MATRRRVDDSDEEEATAIDLRQQSKAPASPQAPGGARKPAPAAPSAPPRRPAPIADADDDEDATEFLSVRPRPAASPAAGGLPLQGRSGPGASLDGRSGAGGAAPAPSPSTAPPAPAPAPRSVPSSPPEPALRARGRAVPLAAAPEEAAPASSSSPEPLLGRAGPDVRAPSTPQSPQAPGGMGRGSRDSTEPLLDVENLPRAPRPLPGNTATSPVGFPAAGVRHPPIEESTTGSHTGTASVPRITRIHVISDTGSGAEGTANSDDDDDDSEPTLPPNSPEARKLGAAAQAVSQAVSQAVQRADKAGLDKGGQAALDKAGLEKARADDARPLESARIRKAATIVQNLDDETQAPEGADSTQAAGSNDDARAHRPVPATADSEDGRAIDGAHDGTLVVEAPTDAVVVVNGVDRGKGVVRVTGLDRLARHAVRIHAPGFQPWSGSVTLEGKPAAKIRPTLKRRAR